MIFVELTSSIRFAVVTSSLNGERVELSLANKMKELAFFLSFYKKLTIQGTIITVNIPVTTIAKELIAA